MKLKSCGVALLSLLALCGCASAPSAGQFSGDASAKMPLMIDREAIRETVKKNLPQLEPCYLEAIEKRPGAEGKIVLVWRLNGEGKVTTVQVKEAGPKIEMASACLMEKVRSWTFPKPSGEEGEVEVVYPFVFSENGRLPKD